MKSKYRFRRILSGVMAAVTILSTVISPLTVYASEEPKTAEPPAYESVKDLLDEEEVVKANNLELEVGQEFDVSSDRTNLEIKDESKVKVIFQKAENDAGENFSTSHADTYHAVYYVEPVNQNHPVYQIGRNLIVKEPVAASQSEPQTEQAVTEEDTGSDDEEAASQEETETVPVETEIVEPETAESEKEEPEVPPEKYEDDVVNPDYVPIDWEKTKLHEIDEENGRYSFDASSETENLKPGSILTIDADTASYIVIVKKLKRDNGKISIEARKGDLCDIFANTEFTLSTGGESARNSSKNVMLPQKISFLDIDGEWKEYEFKLSFAFDG